MIANECESKSLTVCTALYTVAKLPRPISSCLWKLPILSDSFGRREGGVVLAMMAADLNQRNRLLEDDRDAVADSRITNAVLEYGTDR